MKKNSKKGFSLAEVLISVGIVSVIATLGFSVARTNLDRAYNMYVYTGAKYLSDAITDAEIRGLADDADELRDHLQDLFNARIDNNSGELITRNGISYNINQVASVANTNKPIYRIVMHVPERRTAGGNPPVDYVFFHVNDNQRYPALFPQEDLDTRIDLLKYYIRIPGVPDNPRERNYFSFRDVACGYLEDSVSLTISEEENLPILDCQNANAPQQVPENGILTMARP